MANLQRSRGILPCVLVLTIFFVENGICRWWSIAQDGMSNKTMSDCDEIDGLTNFQKKWCRRNLNHMVFVGEGVSKAIDECQHQFRNHRWNCPTVNDSSVFGKLADRNTREMAFVEAITAAGVVHSIAEACQRELLPKRKCPDPELAPTSAEMNLDGIYSPYTSHASELAKDFINGKRNYKPKKLRDAMEVHNNNFGRMVVVRTSKTMCKCYGLKGCNLKTCWKQVRDFRVVGDELEKAYHMAIEVKMNREKFVQRRIGTKPIDTDLVYADSSPDYCMKDVERGIIGTVGRECNSTSLGPENCQLMCCGRGYTTKRIHVTKVCNGTTGRLENCDRTIHRQTCN